MSLTTIGIRLRLFLLGILPTLLIMVVVLWMTYARMQDLFEEFGEELLAERAATIAAEIDRDTHEAVTAARVMAIAAEQGLASRRGESVAFARAVLQAYPQFVAAYYGYEPEATPPPAAGEDVPAEATDETGRFIPYWFRDFTDETQLRLTPLVQLEGLYYEGNKRRFNDASELDKAMVTEPYEYEGRLMVEQTYPITSDGRFRGVAGVDRSLIALSDSLEMIKQRQEAAGWNLEIILLSRLGKVIASTVDEEEMDTRPITETPYADILGDFHSAVSLGSVVRRPDPLSGDASLFAGARTETGPWTVVMQMPEEDLLARVREPILASAGVAAGGVAVAIGLLLWLTSSLTARINTAVAASRRVAGGDLTGAIDAEDGDETGQLLRDIGGMTESLRALVSEVKRASVDLSSTAQELSAASRQQEHAITALGASTSQAAAASRQISATGQELLSTMNDVARVSTETADVASVGRSDLEDVGRSMEQLETATEAFAERLSAIRQRAEDINLVITTITKVADQTNLLSINAAIEAEKAGSYGHGFLVVAREIRRLADQTAVATLDIERLVEQMQTAVTAGVDEMGRFSEEVRAGVARVAAISATFADVIGKVQTLSDRFDQVNTGMESQSSGASQISEALVTLNDGTRTAAEALREFKSAAGSMVASVEGLTDAVGRFRVEDEAVLEGWAK
ncbi:MAG: methyl-accepting chemotaxis protein [Pirellulales bacterium]|jgi:methyl-accepting chemotaxis protein|nr:methyl-accepting chemotaxis protein [Pirellulales bacterium]